MSEARELFERFKEQVERDIANIDRVEDLSLGSIRSALQCTANAIERTLAIQPEPAAVPDLPEFLHLDEETQSWWVDLGNGRRFWLYSYGAAEYDRLAEAARILAARRRAGL